MTDRWIFLLFISFISTNAQSTNDLPFGHPYRCHDILKGKYTDLPTLGDLPGDGFDNLLNVERASVIGKQYTMCKTTDDGQFLIPDAVTVVPTKKSHLQTVSSYFEHWDDFTSTTSSSINIQAGFRSFFVKISGKFSREYEAIKTRQYFQKSRTLRMQLRHSRYRANLVSGPFLHPSFKRALEEIAIHVMANRTKLAKYKSQVLVRQYGTHIVTGKELGASLVKIDQLSEEIDAKSESEKLSIQQAAEISFFDYVDNNPNRTHNFSFGFGYSQSSMNKAITQYATLRQSTEIYSLGGSVISLSQDIENSWSRSVEDNLVALDKSGDPIYYFITQDTLPELADSTIRKLTKVVRDAVYSYYKHNVIRGCTSPTSPNFSFEANVDDGSCKADNSSLPFGGVYQQCTYDGPEDLCQDITSTNSLTGSNTCPLGFKSILLNSGTKSKVTFTKTSRSCGFLWLKTCYDVHYYTSTAHYEAYWCYATTGENPLLFGGVFTPYHVNEFTQSQSCPSGFFSVTILDYLSVCLSQDKGLGKRNSLPFGGFFSCREGNPLSLNKGNNSTYIPHGCPNGFSQHLAYIDDGCEIDFCIKTGALDSLSLPGIQRPPYMELPTDTETDHVGVANNGTIFDLDELALAQGSLNKGGSCDEKATSSATFSQADFIYIHFLCLFLFVLTLYC